MKIAKPAFTPEFRDLAVKRGKAGESVGGVAKQLGLVEQTLRNWVKAAAKGTPNGVGSRMVTPEGEGTVAAASRERDSRPPQAPLQGYKVTTDSRHALPVAENLWARPFTPTAPNQLRTSDIPYWWTEEGWLYLAIVLDLFNREVVGGSIKPRMTADLGTDALTMAWFRRRPAPGLRHHSDRGSQYASPAFQDKLKEYGMICSMSRKGNGGDNAPTESWFNSFQNERGHGVRHASPAAMKATSLQSETPAFEPGLPVACSVHGKVARQAESGKTGSMNPTLWKTNNRGKLSYQIDFIVCDHSPLARTKGGLSRSTAPPQPAPVGQIPHDGAVAPPAFVGPAAGDVGRLHLLPLCQAPLRIRIGPCTASISRTIFSLPCRR